MTVGRGEEDKLIVGVTACLAVRIQNIAGYYNRRSIRSAASLGRDSASMGPVEAEYISKLACGGFFDY